jgi:alkylation response protein AidB-like acyl-CoA dehydrogenase
MRWKIAEMYKDIEVDRRCHRACACAASADLFPDPLLAAVAAASYCNEMALRVTSEAIQVHGGYGFTDEFPVCRFYRGARYGDPRRRHHRNPARLDRQARVGRRRSGRRHPRLGAF